MPKNVLRHTAITMRVNATGDIEATARWAGNSPAVVVKNYLGAGTPDDAKKFYALEPETEAEVVSNATALPTELAAQEAPILAR